MSASTTQFDLGRTRDLTGRTSHPWFRRVVLALMAAFIAAALAGMLGQSPQTRITAGDAATLTVKMPERVRGGLMWPARIELRARENLSAPTLVLGSGFVRGMQLNTIEPSPTSETTRPPKADDPAALAFTYPSMRAGDTLTVYLQLQVNPTTVGRQDATVSLEAPGLDPVRSPATLTVLP